MQPIFKFFLLTAFAFAPVFGQAQLTQSSISGSANIWTTFAGSDIYLSYDRGTPLHFFSVGATAVLYRSRMEYPDTQWVKNIDFEGPSGQMRYGVFAEYGIFPLAEDTARFRPYFSAILATRFYSVGPDRRPAIPEFNIWENELNIGYGLRVQMLHRLALFSRFGFALVHTSFNEKSSLQIPKANDFNTHFDFRVGTTYYLKR